MPEGTAPSKDATFYLVDTRGSSLGAFGPEYEEITRLGLASQRFSQTTSRGDLTQVRAIDFAVDENETRERIADVEGMQSYEVNLSSTSTGKSWMVFLRRVAPMYQPIVDTGRGAYMITYNLTVQRTK